MTHIFSDEQNKLIDTIFVEPTVDSFSAYLIAIVDQQFLTIFERIKDENVPRIKFPGGTQVPEMSYRHKYIERLRYALGKSRFTEQEQENIVAQEEKWSLGVDLADGSAYVRATLVVKVLIESSFYVPEQVLELVEHQRVQSTKAGSEHKQFVKFFIFAHQVITPKSFFPDIQQDTGSLFVLEKIPEKLDFVSDTKVVIGTNFIGKDSLNEMTRSHQGPATKAIHLIT